MRRRLSDESGFSLVELLVVMVIASVIAAATTNVVIQMMRTEVFQQNMQAVMDDGRLSLQAIRREVREARQILPTSCAATGDCTPSDRLHFWIDRNQDSIRTPDEIICYLTEPIGPDQWQLVRWTRAVASADGCSPDVRPTGAQVIARTLTNPNPFVDLEPLPSADPLAPQTRNIRVLLDLEVQRARNDFGSISVETIVRVRNVG
jgi:prepilin-type N-terminal cleavage/methylation domain-containing protein